MEDCKPVSETKVPEGSEDLITPVSKFLNGDLFLFSGYIYKAKVEEMMDLVCNAKKSENVGLILTTFGGDPDEAYRLASYLKASYKKLYLYVFGMCKSAGTLIGIGADEIIMSKRGEFGPLDIQMKKEDTLGDNSSGLDIYNALNDILKQTYDTFYHCFSKIIENTRGRLTTKTAASIATDLAIGLYRPITEQIDPLRIGEVHRAITVAYEYGKRLGARQELLDRLIYSYPSHSFVIDVHESKEIFNNVREPNQIEEKFEKFLVEHSPSRYGADIIRMPDYNQVFIEDLSTIAECINKSKESPGGSDGSGEIDSSNNSHEADQAERQSEPVKAGNNN